MLLVSFEVISSSEIYLRYLQITPSYRSNICYVLMVLFDYGRLKASVFESVVNSSSPNLVSPLKLISYVKEL